MTTYDILKSYLKTNNNAAVNTPAAPPASATGQSTYEKLKAFTSVKAKTTPKAPTVNLTNYTLRQAEEAKPSTRQTYLNQISTEEGMQTGLDDLESRRKALSAEIVNLYNAGKIEEANAKAAEVRSLNNRVDALNDERYPDKGIAKTAGSTVDQALSGESALSNVHSMAAFADEWITNAGRNDLDRLEKGYSWLTGKDYTGKWSEDYVSPLRQDATELATAAQNKYAEAMKGHTPFEKKIIRAGKIVGDMLGTAALTGGLTAGAYTGAASAAGQTTAATLMNNATKLAISAGAAGQSYVDAMNNGANMDDAAAYGLLSGSLEYLAESLFGGNPLVDKNAGLVTKAVKYLGGNKKLLSFLASRPVEILNEGFEEIVSGVLNPLWQRLTYAPNAEWATAKELLDQGIDGVLAALLMQGGNTALNATAKIGQNPTQPQNTVPNPPANQTQAQDISSRAPQATESNVNPVAPVVTTPQANVPQNATQSVTEGVDVPMTEGMILEQKLNALREEQKSIEERLETPFAVKDANETRQLENRLTRIYADIDTLVAEESRATVKTPLKTILDNLSQYRRSDLESLAEQISDGNWDGYEELSRSELENALREAIVERTSEMNVLETQAPKYGLSVRPVEAAPEQSATLPEGMGAKSAIPPPDANSNVASSESTGTGKVFKVGDTVYASDRGNYGHVLSYNKDNNTYLVHFKAKDGATANVVLSAEELSSTKKGTFKTKTAEDYERKGQAQPPEYENPLLAGIPQASNSVVLDGTKQKRSIGSVLSNAYTRAVDTLSPIADRFSKDAKDKSGVLSSNARNAGGTVNYILQEGLVNRAGETIGKSLADIAKSIPEGQEQAFWDYMAERHNIDRARERKNVIANHTSEQSQQIVEVTEAENPAFKATGDELVNWIETFMREWGVNSGLISSEIYDDLRAKYPSYFPTQREFDEIENALPLEVRKQFVDNRTPVKTATGSERNIKNPIENIMGLVNSTVKSARYNAVGQEIVNSIANNPEGLSKYGEIVSEEEGSASKADNVVTVIINGEKVYLKITDQPLLNAVKGLPKTTITVPVASEAVQLFKSLITQKNPFFAVRNIARDVPTAYTYGSEGNPLLFGAGLGKATRDIAKNNENYQRYKAVGGGMANFFNSSETQKATKDLTANKSIGQKIVGGIEAFNNITETAPRLAEFNRVFEKTGDVQQALHAANNVTVNFARGGDVVKAVDRNAVPYLNAGVQGLDKFVRSFETPRKALTTLARGGIMVTLPHVLLALINRRDEDYEELTNYQKDNYFCIPYGDGHNDGKVGNGKFIKIPKSRELGILFSALPERILRAAQGDAEAFKGFGTSFATSFAPTNPFENNILSPLVYNLPSNKTYSDAAIIPQSMIQDGRSKYLQYDEKTSKLTIAIAKYAHEAGVDISPKQMDYIINAYTGVLADFILPATTPSATVGSTILSQFIADPSYSNQAITDFYDSYDKSQTSAADKNITEAIPSSEMTVEEKLESAMSHASSQLSELSKLSLKAGIGSLSEEDNNALLGYGLDSTLPNKELQQAIREKRIAIAQEANEVYKNSATDEIALDLYRKTDVGNFTNNDEEYILTPSEHSKYSDTVKIAAENQLSKIEQLGGFDGLTSDQQDNAVSRIAEYADAQAQKAIVTARGDSYEGTENDLIKALEAEVTLAEFYKAYDLYAGILKDDTLKTSQKPTEFTNALERELPGLSDSKEEELKAMLDYWSGVRQDSDRYDTMRDYGLSEAKAKIIADSVFGIVGNGTNGLVTNEQKQTAIASTSYSDADKLKAIKAYYDPKTDDSKTYAKYATANKYNISVKTYAQYRTKLKEVTGGKSINGDYAKKAIDSMTGLTKQQKAVLYALTNTGWKTNPYLSGYTGDTIQWAS